MGKNAAECLPGPTDVALAVVAISVAENKTWAWIDNAVGLYPVGPVWVGGQLVIASGEAAIASTLWALGF